MMLLALKAVLMQQDIEGCFPDISARVEQKGFFFQVSVTTHPASSVQCSYLQTATISYEIKFAPLDNASVIKYSTKAQYQQTSIFLACRLFYCNELYEFQSAFKAALTISYMDVLITQELMIQPFETERGDLFDCVKNFFLQQSSRSFQQLDMTLQTCTSATGDFDVSVDVYYAGASQNFGTVKTLKPDQLNLVRVACEDCPGTVYKQTNKLQSLVTLRQNNQVRLRRYVITEYDYQADTTLLTTRQLLWLTTTMSGVLIVIGYFTQRAVKLIIRRKRAPKFEAKINEIPFFTEPEDVETGVI